jgi:hypothetical protein
LRSPVEAIDPRRSAPFGAGAPPDLIEPPAEFRSRVRPEGAQYCLFEDSDDERHRAATSVMLLEDVHWADRPRCS